MVFRSYGGFLVFIIICSCLADTDVTGPAETTDADVQLPAVDNTTATAGLPPAAAGQPPAAAGQPPAAAGQPPAAAGQPPAAAGQPPSAANNTTAAASNTTAAAGKPPVAANNTTAAANNTTAAAGKPLEAANKPPEAAENSQGSNSNDDGLDGDRDDHGGGLYDGNESDDTSPPPASSAAENDRPADDDDVDYVESVIDESIEEYSAVESQPEDTELETAELVVPVAKSTQFLPYFIAAVVLFVVLYLGYHQRNKIIALIVEGKRSLSKKKREPRPKAGEYSRLTTSTEDVDSRAKGFTY